MRCPRCATVFSPSASAPPSPPPEAEPDADFSWNDGEPEPAPAPKSRSNQPKAEPAKRKSSAIFIVCGLVAIGAAAAVIVAFSGGKPKSPPDAVADKKDPPKVPPKRPPTTPARPTIPPEFAELFTATADRPAPTVPFPVLKKVGAGELAVTLPALKAEQPPAGDGKMTLDELKQATAYIKVEAGAGVRGTGSGFVIRADKDAVLVATNFHVVSPRSAPPGSGPGKVTVVFDSGLPSEWQSPGEVVATDPEIDLAVVKLELAKHLPRPIDPALAPKLMETMAVRIYGFPFGATLATGTRNPNINIGDGTISSLPRNAAGRIESVRLSAALNPGNSGGPVVDGDGRLVGVAVATIKGSGIGFAIPAEELSSLLAGRVSPPVVMPVGMEAGKAVFQVVLQAADPLGRVKGLTLHVAAGRAAVKDEREPAGGWKRIAGAEKVELKLASQLAAGEFRVATPEGAGAGTTVLLQLECRAADGAATFSPPVAHELVLDTIQTASDAIPMEAFRKDLARYAGQVVVVRGKLAPGASRRGAAYELAITDEADAAVEGLTFVADRDVATQLSELPPDELLVPARLTLRVGKAAGGTTPARVTHLDFIGRGNRVVKSVPSAEAVTDPLVALNRNPEKFVGQTLTVACLLSTLPGGRDDEPELAVQFLSEQRPQHLHFVTTPLIAARLKDMAPPGRIRIAGARLTVRVEDKELDGVGPRVVTVLKIEMLNADGETRLIE